MYTCTIYRIGEGRYKNNRLVVRMYVFVLVSYWRCARLTPCLAVEVSEVI